MQFANGSNRCKYSLLQKWLVMNKYPIPFCRPSSEEYAPSAIRPALPNLPPERPGIFIAQPLPSREEANHLRVSCNISQILLFAPPRAFFVRSTPLYCQPSTTSSRRHHHHTISRPHQAPKPNRENLSFPPFLRFPPNGSPDGSPSA